MFIMNVVFLCISLNARDLRDSTKRKSIFLFCKGEKAHFILLQETHSTLEDETSGGTKLFLIMVPKSQQG